MLYLVAFASKSKVSRSQRLQISPTNALECQIIYRYKCTQLAHKIKVVTDDRQILSQLIT